MTSKIEPLIARVVLASIAVTLGITLFLGGFWAGSARGGDNSWAYDTKTGNPTGPQGQPDFWNYDPETGQKVSNYSPGVAPEMLAALWSGRS
jgi:hypothetical protein